MSTRPGSSSEMIEFRDQRVKDLGLELLVHINRGRREGGRQSVRFRLAAAHRRDEDAGRSSRRSTNMDSTRPSAARAATRKNRAPRSACFRCARREHRWDPKNQRPEPWRLYNTRKRPGESFRVFPLSNWTEADVWDYIAQREHSRRAALFRQGAAGGAARRLADHARRRAHETAARRDGRRI